MANWNKTALQSQGQWAFFTHFKLNAAAFSGMQSDYLIYINETGFRISSYVANDATAEHIAANMTNDLSASIASHIGGFDTVLDSNWHTYFQTYDNTDTGEEVKVWIDGVKQTLNTGGNEGNSRTIPASIGDSCQVFLARNLNNITIAWPLLLYNWSFFVGIPDEADLHTSGSPKDISGVPGIHALCIANEDDTFTDAIIDGLTYTKTGSPTASTDIPS